MKRIVYTLIYFSIFFTHIIAQNNVGNWNSYLAYAKTTSVAESNNFIFAVAEGSLYSYNKEDNSIHYYSRESGLHDNNISHICFNTETNSLLITYSNGNIDLMGNKDIYNIPYLYNNSNITNKTINDIFINKQYAYLSTAFGIVIVNMDTNIKEITDTYRLNTNVKSVCIKDNFIYAATDNGILKGDMNDNLLDPNEWLLYNIESTSLNFNDKNIHKIILFQNNLCFYIQGNGVYYQYNNNINSLLISPNIKNITLQNNKLIIYTNTNLYAYTSFTSRDALMNVGPINDVTSTKDVNTYWIASDTKGIKGIKKKNDNFEIILEEINNENNYPKRNLNYFMTINNNNLYITGGGRTVIRNGNPGTLMIYNNNDKKWFNLDEDKINKSINKQFEKLENCRDYTGIAIDPKNSNHYYISTYGEGVLELLDNEYIKLYNHTNSSLNTIFPNHEKNQYTYNRIGGVTFDKEGNLWMSNCEVESVLKVLKSDGTWGSFKFSNFTDVAMADKVTITSDNRKWINVPGGDKSGIFIFDDNGTIDDTNDDESRFIPTFTDSNGNIDASGYFCITEDKNAQVWIGTNRGPIICTNYRDINNISCTRIIRINNETGEPYYLLDGEQINAIAVDGGNRKWIGTQSSGVFLVSEDGMETISNFTTANSPLPSNQVNSIAIDQTTGEVFIGTENGLVSYMSDATEGSEDYSDVYAYPNPVRPEHNDRVTIVGLMNDSNVKITDMRGNIIYQGKSAGGTFTWDCRRRGGGRVATGIYLVLSATPEAKESVVTKIMVVK